MRWIWGKREMEEIFVSIGNKKSQKNKIVYNIMSSFHSILSDIAGQTRALANIKL